MTTASAAAAAAAWPVCTICYEDLRPLSDQHLHCLPACGHVFHALCLEQWLEYCPGGKKKLTCPICKQPCGAAHRPTRLYFQSTGSGLSQSFPSSETASAAADPEVLAAEVARLEQKAASVSKVLEEQRAVIQNLNAEVVNWREQAVKEEAKQEVIRKEKECVQQLLSVKMEELSRKTLECDRLQEKSLALAKELAALKLSTDMNLEEEEILKLASLGNHGNPENAVDVLKRSLAHRNKSYKELMAQCNILGRSESRVQQKLEKAKEQIKKLKARVQDLEKELEEKENGLIRDLRLSKKLKTDQKNSSNIAVNNGFCIPVAGNGSQTLRCDEVMLDPNRSAFSCNDSPHLNWCLNVPEGKSHLNSKANTDSKCADVIDLDADNTVFKDEHVTRFSTKPFENLNNASDFQSRPSISEHDNKKPTILECGISSYVAEDTYFLKRTVAAGRSTFRDNLMKNNEGNLQESSVKRSMTVTTSAWAKEILMIDGISKQATSLASGTGPQQIHNLNAISDDFQTPGGILGLDGARKSTGKWCKSLTAPGYLNANANNGNLIAMGPDGRGGKVKILRDLGRFQDSKTEALWPKVQKLGGKGGQSQIDHFFGRK